ncbi:MAG: branched-chain amino acid ABC transporter permease [Fervidicoccaceae archaeon]
MLDIVVKAAAYASCIGLGAASITLIYSSTRTFNFAHASMVAWGFYVTFALTYATGLSPYLFVPIAALFSALLGLITYYSVNRRLLRVGASELTLMMSTLGVDLVLFGALNIFADYLLKVHKYPAKYFLLETREIYIAGLRLVGVVAPAVLALAVILLGVLLYRTKLGIAFRATIENQALAQLCGVNPNKIYSLAWLIGGALAGLAGSLLSLVVSGYTAVGMTLIVTFFAGSIVGGLYSVYGSLLGGLLVGLGEYLGVALLGQAIGGWIYAYRPAIPLALIAATLLLQPSGLAALMHRTSR